MKNFLRILFAAAFFFALANLGALVTKEDDADSDFLN